MNGLTDDQVLAALSELMIGVPLYWVRQNRSRWTSWNDFKRDVVARFRKSIDFQTKIRREAERRTQGEGESVISYVTCIRTILEQFPRKMDEQAQIDLIFNNLHPEISRYLTRDLIGTVEGLIDKAQMAEGFLNIRAEYQPPPKPEESLMPQLAFDTVKTVKKTVQKTATVAGVSEKVENQSIKEVVAQAISEHFKEYKKEKAKRWQEKKKEGPPKKADEAQAAKKEVQTAKGPGERKKLMGRPKKEANREKNLLDLQKAWLYQVRLP